MYTLQWAAATILKTHKPLVEWSLGKRNLKPKEVADLLDAFLWASLFIFPFKIFEANYSNKKETRFLNFRVPFEEHIKEIASSYTFYNVIFLIVYFVEIVLFWIAFSKKMCSVWMMVGGVLHPVFGFYALVFIYADYILVYEAIDVFLTFYSVYFTLKLLPRASWAMWHMQMWVLSGFKPPQPFGKAHRVVSLFKVISVVAFAIAAWKYMPVVTDEDKTLFITITVIYVLSALAFYSWHKQQTPLCYFSRKNYPFARMKVAKNLDPYFNIMVINKFRYEYPEIFKERFPEWWEYARRFVEHKKKMGYHDYKVDEKYGLVIQK